ncbi:hypothetical protein SNE25_04130 [Mucilaginibacter sabulilitoris]|uniref:Uncharacterized protein n=1 Tax=Mucilaginibacter sabulilitoris TaxID=1173583 RepID=A0ABZ0TP61_9SPHI|nr:hypothetical protein [Mucilaginibacter sabulilitoris]WPU94707.1 hypothetical protein SNE25_04130 [Mucilaginibacter sabulilitoris]
MNISLAGLYNLFRREALQTSYYSMGSKTIYTFINLAYDQVNDFAFFT